MATAAQRWKDLKIEVDYEIGTLNRAIAKCNFIDTNEKSRAELKIWAKMKALMEKHK